MFMNVTKRAWMSSVYVGSNLENAFVLCFSIHDVRRCAVAGQYDYFRKSTSVVIKARFNSIKKQYA